MKKVVPDTSAIINGSVSEKVRSGEWADVEIIIPNAVLAELELQANEGRETGFVGLAEIEYLVSAAKEGHVSVTFKGERPSPEEFRNAKYGYIDARIRELARQENATLVTSDYVQAEVAKAYGMEVEYIKEEIDTKEPRLFDYFDETTLSVHLKEGVPPMAKKGRPGRFRLVKIGDEPVTRDYLKDLAKEILELTRERADAYVEIERRGATVVQFGEYRISICFPPFADGWEITAVHPIYKATLEDYGLSDKLLTRFKEQAEGILVAGPPGAGKSTFAQALAEFYASMGKIVKTMESPRDLQVPPEITQYAPLEGSMEKTADILLLVRPDYTIYDELRKTRDFEIFADMRMAGVGMIGIVHASRPVEAIQRFIGRIELGLIPHIVDTVIFVKDGEVKKVYSLEMKVKVPSGMSDDDLARPVVEVRDFDTGALEYEIYTFGEETVVIPVNNTEKSALHRYAETGIRQELEKVLRIPFDVEVSGGRIVLKVPEAYVPSVIGRAGRNITELEKRIGLPITVQPLSGPSITEKDKYYIIKLGKSFAKKKVGITANDEVVITGKTNRRGELKIRKDTPEGQLLRNLLKRGASLDAVTL